MADSWKTDGDCEVCRKKDYCNKSCTAHKKAVIKHIREKIVEKHGEEVSKSISDLAIMKLFARAVMAPDDSV